MKKPLNFLSTLVITLLISGVLYLGSQGKVSKNPDKILPVSVQILK